MTGPAGGSPRANMNRAATGLAGRWGDEAALRDEIQGATVRVTVWETGIYLPRPPGPDGPTTGSQGGRPRGRRAPLGPPGIPTARQDKGWLSQEDRPPEVNWRGRPPVKHRGSPDLAGPSANAGRFPKYDQQLGLSTGP